MEMSEIKPISNPIMVLNYSDFIGVPIKYYEINGKYVTYEEYIRYQEIIKNRKQLLNEI